MFTQNTHAWLARAGGDVVEMEEAQHIEDHGRCLWQEISEKCLSRMEEEEEEGNEFNEWLLTPCPDSAGANGLPNTITLETPHTNANDDFHEQEDPEQAFMVDDINETMSLNTEPFDTNIDLSCTDSGASIKPKHSAPAYHQYRNPPQVSKRLKFRLIIDPPKGEKIDKWRKLQRPLTQMLVIDDLLLRPPPKQPTRSERKRQKRLQKERIQLRLQKLKSWQN